MAGSQVLQARLLAARAACALLPSSCYPEAADALLQQVTSLQQRVTSQNQLHGWLLQVGLLGDQAGLVVTFYSNFGLGAEYSSQSIGR